MSNPDSQDPRGAQNAETAQTSTLHPVTPARHTERRWHRYVSYDWAAPQVIVPLVGMELARAAVTLPIAFVQQPGTVASVAVLGLEPGVNLFVGADGRWIGGYVPAMLRSRPFLLLPAPDGRRVLCVDEAAGRVQVGGAGEPFFDAEGKLAGVVGQVFDFLSQLENARQAMARACDAIHASGVLVPWAIQVKTDNGERRTEGLLRVDEEKLAALSSDEFLKLRETGALTAIYAHLLSTQHIALLGELGRARFASRNPPVMPVTSGGDLDLSFLQGGDTLRFS
ncbi:SapC family protein [Ramlibacter sp.]|uniref:SapC family protein n=1 Tax=Ramlibacter sp. TaxID=1917967 RepID=UPI003D0CD0AF